MQGLLYTILSPLSSNRLRFCEKIYKPAESTKNRRGLRAGDRAGKGRHHRERRVRRSFSSVSSCGQTAAESAAAPHPLRDRASEEEQIRRALAAAGGNKSQAAKLLGIDRKTLYNKLHLYGIE